MHPAYPLVVSASLRLYYNTEDEGSATGLTQLIEYIQDQSLPLHTDFADFLIKCYPVLVYRNYLRQ